MSLYLSRLTVSRSAPVAALDALIEPDDAGARLDAHHRLLWTAFAGDPAAVRDFLWRAEGSGQFMVLSARPPQAGPLFDPPQTKPFVPELAAGDRLRFALRANATRAKSGAGRVDVVMDALHAVPKGERAAQRMELAQQAAQEWLAGQGTKHGFELGALAVDDYSVADVPSRDRRRGRGRFGILDMTGTLTVTDPTAFIARLAAGFGRAKSFGCGLMLIRRE